MTNTKSTEPTAIVERDMFAAPEYVNPDARLPKIQAVRGENGASECGYFITVNELAKAGWKSIDESKLITYEYNSGGKELGLLIQSPRMLVVQRSPLFAFDRALSMQEKRTVVVGQYNKQLHSDRTMYGTGCCYEVVLLDPNNQPLHEISFAYVPKGANQASFSQHWQQAVLAITLCHAKANGIAPKPKDARFNSLCVFQFTVKRELAGNNAKSPACKVDTHEEPNQANWTRFFLGRHQETAMKLLDLLSPSSKLCLPAAIDDREEIEGELVLDSRSALLEKLLNLADEQDLSQDKIEQLLANSLANATVAQIEIAIDQLQQK
jgi:hypothetical protein